MEATYFDEETQAFINSYEFFQSIMGNMTLVYVDFNVKDPVHLNRLSAAEGCPEPPPIQGCQQDCTYSLGRGWTEGHTITFHRGSTEYTCTDGNLVPTGDGLVLLDESRAGNVTHELAHSLSNFSGLGTDVGSLKLTLDPLFNNQLFMDDFETAIKVAKSNCNIDRVALGTQRALPREQQADLVLILSCDQARQYLITKYPELNSLLKTGVDRSMLYHTPPEDVASQFGTTPVLVTTSTRVVLRSQPSGLQLGDAINSNVDVLKIGQTFISPSATVSNPGIWIYVQVSVKDYNRYGWIHHSVLQGDNKSLPCLTNESNPTLDLEENCRQ